MDEQIAMTAREFNELLSSGNAYFKKNRLIIKQKSGNKKIMNATPTTIDGIRFRSKIESYAYHLFKNAGLLFEYENKRFTLNESYIHEGKKIKHITWKPDFVFEDRKLIVDTKGFKTEAFKMKLKMFQLKYPEYTVLLPSTKEHIHLLLLYFDNKLKLDDLFFS